MAHSEVAVRTYADTDLPGIAGLYDSTSRDYPRFGRDEVILQHFTNYPGVGRDGIFVAVQNEGIAGLAIVSITDEGDLRQGSIVELQANDRPSLDCLIRAASRYCADRDVDMIVVVPPPDLETDMVFKSWLPFERTVMMCRPLSILPLLHALLDVEMIRRSHAGRKVLFALERETVQVKISADCVEVVQTSKAPDKSDTLITVSSKTLLAIAAGVVSPHAAYLARSVRVRSIMDVPLALHLLRVLRLNMPWFVALGDSM